MRVITWNKSFRGAINGEGGKDNYDAEEYETHATVLDKLLAWEKKLYEEVKVRCIIYIGLVFALHLFRFFSPFLFPHPILGIYDYSCIKLSLFGRLVSL